jgi:hypothetical protein
MAIQIQGNGGVVQDVGGTTFRGANVHIKPLEYGALGHYSFSITLTAAAAQVANSRVLEIRNTHATNLIIPTRLTMRAIQTAAGTAQFNALDAYKCTSFSAVDTVNTVTPVSSVKRTSMAAFPGGAAVRHVTIAGAAAGMTGGTLTKDTQAFATLGYNVAAAINTTTIWGPTEAIPQNGIWEAPFVLVQNEGIIVENRILNVTSYGITWILDFAWAEVTAF